MHSYLNRRRKRRRSRAPLKLSSKAPPPPRSHSPLTHSSRRLVAAPLPPFFRRRLPPLESGADKEGERGKGASKSFFRSSSAAADGKFLDRKGGGEGGREGKNASLSEKRGGREEGAGKKS